MKTLLILLAILTAAAAATAQTDYRTYSNARFGYSVSYPSDLLAPAGEADNGDGQAFTGDGAEMRVYGSNLLTNGTLLKEYNAVAAEHGPSVTYRIYRKNFFVVSSLRDGRIFYRKTIARPNGGFITFMIEYDESKRRTYDAAVTRMVKSFK